MTTGGMIEPTLAFVLVALITVSGTVMAPIFLAMLLARQRRGDQAAEYARQDRLAAIEHDRQDKVAAMAAKAAAALATSQLTISDQVAEAAGVARKFAEKASADLHVNAVVLAAATAKAASDLHDNQDVIARTAAEKADLLLAANDRVAADTRLTHDKLNVIHSLVNSNMTASIQDQLDANIVSLALMHEIADLKEAAGQHPQQGAITAVGAVEAKIADLRSTLADRKAAEERLSSNGTMGDESTTTSATLKSGERIDVTVVAPPK